MNELWPIAILVYFMPKFLDYLGARGVRGFEVINECRRELSRI